MNFDVGHPNIIAEVCGMQKSGDYICSSCGALLTPSDMKERREAAEKQAARKRPASAERLPTKTSKR
jgi:uncharacterized Zn finger protein (UPF0148 family)